MNFPTNYLFKQTKEIEMKFKYLLVVLLLLILSLNSQAQMRDYTVKGGVQYNQALLFGEFNKYKFSFIVRGYLNVRFNKIFSGEFGIGYGQLAGTDEAYNSNPVEWKTTVIPIDIRLRIAPFTKLRKVNPYLYIGGGLIRYDVTDTHAIGSSSPDPIEKDGMTGMVLGGIGSEFMLSSNVLLDLSAGFTYTFTDDLNYYSINDFKDGIGTFGIGLTFTGESCNTDYDRDGLKRCYEERIGTDPDNPDTDGDGLKDGEEVNTYSTDPLNTDTDGDVLSDYDEVIVHKTNPTNPDTDGDGLNDGEEINRYVTNPNNADTDGDRLNDGEEVNNHKTDPLEADTDGDRLNDGDEVKLHNTDPLNVDTDGGSVNDGDEVARGTDPLDPNDDIEKIEIGKVIILEGINFEYNSADITPDSEETLMKALKTFQDNPEIEVEISGHTDSDGSNSYNMGLSQRRADSVKDWLVGKGIIEERIEAVGYGEENPIAPNDTPENKFKNRRIEFKRTK
jgi:outer membrane protein OmpA-like peptidoglycan-associated protein